MAKTKTLNEDACLRFIDDEGEEARDLLLSRIPGAEKRWEKAFDILAKLLADVRRHFPDAQVYVECNSPLLMLGDSHCNRGNDIGAPQQQLTALHRSMDNWDCGGF